MGSSFNCKSFKGELTPNELHRKFSEHCDEQEYEYGHSSYNGTLSTTSGLKIEDRLFPNRREAGDYVARNTTKWGNSLAVRYRRTKTTTVKDATFNGETQKHRRYKCLHLDYEGIGTRAVPADQLSDEDKTKIVNAWELHNKYYTMVESLKNSIQMRAARLANVEKDFSDEDFKSLKKARRELEKATLLHKSAKKRLISLDKKLGKMVVTETHENGTKWLVGGWTSE